VDNSMQNHQREAAATVKASVILLMILLSSFLWTWPVPQAISEPTRVPDDYQTIQEAINAAQLGDSIIVKGGVYHEHVIVNRSVTLAGEDPSATIVDGGGSGIGVLVTADNVTVGNLTVRDGTSGIVVLRAQNCTIKGNLIREQSYQGIFLSQAQNCIVSRNQAVGTRDGYGININASRGILVEDNRASDNHFDGIGVLSSRDSTVRGNTVNSNSLYGLWVQDSSGNYFYCNNVFGNGKTVDNTALNSWDNGTKGNYWGDYGGSDADADGVGDQPYVVDERTQPQPEDRFPLFRPYVNGAYLAVDVDPPAASFTFSPKMPLVNETVSFDASGSSDSVGKNAIVDFNWNFGDGATATGGRVDHTYAIPGNHTVVLSAVDVAGNEGTASGEVSVRLEDSGDGQLFLTVLTCVLLVSGAAGLFLLLRRRRREAA
jgi:nitrous oxidase accessory protein